MKQSFKLTKVIVISFFVLVTFSFQSCVKGGKCEEVPDLSNSGIQVDFKDNATGKYLYTTTAATIYNIDSLKIYDQNNVPLNILMNLRSIPNASSGAYWSINFGNIYNPSTDAGAYNSEVCRNFIVKYTYNQADTIKACFKARNGDCGSEFEYLNVYYKGELVGSISNDTGIYLTINKK